MRILGLDPGLDATGYAIIEEAGDQLRVLEAGVIVTRRDQELENRLSSLLTEIEDLLREFRPQTAVVEDLYSHYRHPRTAILMGHARGALFAALGKKQIPVVSYSPARIKKALTGSGRASKDQVRRAVDELLLLEGSYPHHTTDALAVALCYFREKSYDFSN